MSALFKPPPPPPPPGSSVGLFCQASTGADGLHGTDMRTKNQEKWKLHFCNQRAEMGHKSGSLLGFAPPPAFPAASDPFLAGVETPRQHPSSVLFFFGLCPF